MKFLYFVIVAAIGVVILSLAFNRLFPAGDEAPADGVVIEDVEVQKESGGGAVPVSSKKPSSQTTQTTQTTKGSVNEEVVIPPRDREGSVYISSVRRRSSQGAPIYINLRTRLNAGETVDVTGWKIVSNSGNMTIPSAVNYYSVIVPNTPGNIVLERNNALYIYFAKRVLPENLRLNTCTGYLNEVYDPTPFLPKRCPRIDDSLYIHLSGDCQNYIRRVGRCETPDPNITNSFRGDEGNECRAFVNNVFSAGYCYRTYGNNPDFLDNEWRAWIDRKSIFDFDHDWIRIYNKDGVLIDDYTY